MGAGRGCLIVLEGCDRCGKSTQAKLLVDALNNSGIKTKLLSFPDRSTMTGRTIDMYLSKKADMSDEAIHLLFSANRWECLPHMKSLLLNGFNLVVDRYAYSGVAYSVAKGLDFEWCMSSDSGLIQPDAVFFLDLPPDVASKRGSYGEERYERLGMQRAAYDVFLRRLKDHTWQVINANQSIDELHNDLKNRTESVFKAIEQKSLQSLWKKEEETSS